METPLCRLRSQIPDRSFSRVISGSGAEATTNFPFTTLILNDVLVRQHDLPCERFRDPQGETVPPFPDAGSYRCASPGSLQRRVMGVGGPGRGVADRIRFFRAGAHRAQRKSYYAKNLGRWPSPLQDNENERGQRKKPDGTWDRCHYIFQISTHVARRPPPRA